MIVSRPAPPSRERATASPATTSPFDVPAFTRSAIGDRRDEVDADAFAAAPLRPEGRRALAYLWNVERSATEVRRQVLATRTRREARYTAFLTTWADDRFWFAAQLARILEAHGITTDVPLPHGTTAADRRLRRAERLDRVAAPVWTTLPGQPVTALHATRGLARESALLVAYRRLLDLEQHRALRPALAPLLDRMSLHRDFFAAEARMRLAWDPTARPLVRALLTRGFHPLRPTGLPVAESHWFQRYLFSEGARARVVRAADGPVRALPGPGTLGPLETALRRERTIR